MDPYYQTLIDSYHANMKSVLIKGGLFFILFVFCLVSSIRIIRGIVRKTRSYKDKRTIIPLIKYSASLVLLILLSIDFLTPSIHSAFEKWKDVKIYTQQHPNYIEKTGYVEQVHLVMHRTKIKIDYIDYNDCIGSFEYCKKYEGKRCRFVYFPESMLIVYMEETND